MTETGTTLGRRLRAARALAGLEQAEIADLIGSSRSTVSNWERGVAEPPATYFVLWALATGQPLEWLAEGCARRDSNPQPSDLYPGDDALEVEHQLLLLVEAVAL
jgi:transcriptional regulator with XRE-family HTH domain